MSGLRNEGKRYMGKAKILMGAEGHRINANSLTFCLPLFEKISGLNYGGFF